ncbi:response regulator transcription factor [Actinotalea sp.]|uniref:response regulator transcription factor n=1 Tax=Actinotalea sp. TaxID=1872145 RepID=UPI003563224D
MSQTPGPNEPGPSTRVLVVEDEVPLASLVASYLKREAFDVEAVGDGKAAIDLARSWHPEVIVLDLGLPGADGIEVCRAVRTFSDCYVIMLTARVEEIDTLVGLSVGADDYVAKPFSPRELTARVKAMMRRPRAASGAAGQAAGTSNDVRQVGGLTVDLTSREVSLDGEFVDLTRTEFDVLAVLISQPRRAFSRSQLLLEIWGRDWVGDAHLVDVHLGHIRRKIGDDASAPVFIQSVRGFGYRMGPGR